MRSFSVWLLFLKRKVFPAVDWQKQARLIPLIVVHALWIYLLSYKLIYAYQITMNLTLFFIGSWLCLQGSAFFLIRSLLKMKAARENAEQKRENNERIQAQILALYEKQDVMDEVWQTVKAQLGHVDVEHLRSAHHQIGAIRNLIYCDNPSGPDARCRLRLTDNLQKQAVPFHYAIEASLLSGVDDFDMNTLLSNLLKNALEAAEGAPDPQYQPDHHSAKADVVYPLYEFRRSAAAKKEADPRQWDEDHHADRGKVSRSGTMGEGRLRG